ncbi:MAG: N-acetyltransferase [Pyrinomonadaceae bacterium]|nr:N-acetyltransferase [Pyrinomonadaceae bacterium]
MEKPVISVFQDKKAGRFQTEIDKETAFIEYEEQNGVVVMTHTEVPANFEGKGIGSELVKKSLEMVRSEGKKVNPLCPFIAAYIRKHNEYSDLLA